MLINLAWRNLWRRKRRTLITAFSVAGGILLSTVFTGSGDYTYTNIIETSAAMGFGHITVEAEGYNDTPSLHKRISGVEDIRRALLATPQVTAAAVRVTGMAMFASAAKSVGGVFFGLDPAVETPEINMYLRAITKGGLPADPSSRDLVVGEKMAEKLKIKIGRKLVYTVTDVNGEIVSEVGRVAGIFRTGVEEVDGAVCLIPIGRARSVVKYAPDEASLVAVFIKDQRKVNHVRAELEARTLKPGMEILTWQKTQSDVNGLIEVDRKSNYVSQLFVGLLIAAGVLNTLFMSVLERKREFGIMMAVGLAPGRLFALVILESLYIALTGLVMGVIITSPVFYLLYHYGLDLRSFVEDGYAIGSVLVDPVLKVRLFRESAVMILCGVFGLTILAGLYPAWKAGRENPVDSIKTI